MVGGAEQENEERKLTKVELVRTRYQNYLNHMTRINQIFTTDTLSSDKRKCDVRFNKEDLEKFYHNIQSEDSANDWSDVVSQSISGTMVSTDQQAIQPRQSTSDLQSRKSTFLQLQPQDNVIEINNFLKVPYLYHAF